MTKFLKAKRLPQIITVLLYICLFIAVIFLMKYVQNLLYSDVKINLTEVVSQNKDVVNSKLNLEVNNLESTGNQILDRLKKNKKSGDTELLSEVYLEYLTDNPDEKLFIADNKGNAVFYDGKTIDISGRSYFKISMEGFQNVSDKIVSRLDGEEIFVISTQLVYNKKIIGTVQKYYSPKEMYEMCSISLFSEEGYMSIINQEGYILISSKNNEYSQENENYFRLLYAEGNKEASKQLQNDVKHEQAGFLETIIDGKKNFTAYTPIEEIHDWYLISSVPTEAISKNASFVIKIFYFILSIVVIIFGVSLYAFLTIKKKEKAKLEKVAYVDNITGGNTLNKFEKDLEAIMEENPQKQFYLLKFDIDNFKFINNYYGFDYGDKILKIIYKSVEDKLLPEERIARLHSDHFVVSLVDVKKDRMEDILKAIYQHSELTIYYSAGLYKIKNSKESINLMIDKAGIAAEVAKGSLHKRIEHYTEKFDEQMIYNEQMKRAMEQALANDEIIPYFQPKVDVNTGEMVGAEALARWRTQDGKLISPNEFIPLCEKTGLIKELDMIIFEKSLIFQKESIKDGCKPIPISANFSRLHMFNSEFVIKILEKINKHNIDPELVEIELTESAVFDNYENITSLISKLHNEGFKISMDDFGSGYSSLNMLKDINIDVLKIDKEFLNMTTNSEKQRIIFSAIAQMANQLDIKVVVEGVENTEHIKLMKEVGCSIAQGFYFSKPMDEKSFKKVYMEGLNV